MPVTGSRDGLLNDNTFGKKVEPIMSVDTLKAAYLTGLNIKDPNSGAPIPNEVYQRYINNAISYLEHFLDISISPVRNFVENRDYDRNAYTDFGFMHLNNYPAIQINSLKMVYFRDEAGDADSLQEIPLSWVRLDPHDGIIRLVPNTNFTASLQLGNRGFFPEVLRTANVPHLWEINYDFGFDTGCVPVMINEAVGMLASVSALTVGGNLVLGAGIAGSSISLDGLSQSIQTTQSAENSAFSATILDYTKRLNGANKDDPHSILRILYNYYNGQSMSVF